MSVKSRKTKPPMGRPPLPPEQTRTRAITVMMTQSDYAEVITKAKSLKRSTSDFVREALLAATQKKRLS